VRGVVYFDPAACRCGWHAQTGLERARTAAKRPSEHCSRTRKPIRPSTCSDTVGLCARVRDEGRGQRAAGCRVLSEVVPSVPAEVQPTRCCLLRGARHVRRNTWFGRDRRRRLSPQEASELSEALAAADRSYLLAVEAGEGVDTDPGR
jgi:hypothetical protein